MLYQLDDRQVQCCNRELFEPILFQYPKDKKKRTKTKILHEKLFEILHLVPFLIVLLNELSYLIEAHVLFRE